MKEHYKKHKFEPIEVIEEYELNFSLGNVIKYILRSPYKNSELNDLIKARDYLDYEIEKQEKEIKSIIEEELNND